MTAAKDIESKSARPRPYLIIVWSAVVIVVLATGAAITYSSYSDAAALKTQAATAHRDLARSSVDLARAETAVRDAEDALTTGLANKTIPTPIALWAGTISPGDPLPSDVFDVPEYSAAVNGIQSSKLDVSQRETTRLAAQMVAGGYSLAADAAERRALSTLESCGAAALLALLAWGVALTLHLRRRRPIRRLGGQF